MVRLFLAKQSLASRSDVPETSDPNPPSPFLFLAEYASCICDLLFERMKPRKLDQRDSTGGKALLALHEAQCSLNPWYHIEYLSISRSHYKAKNQEYPLRTMSCGSPKSLNEMKLRTSSPHAEERWPFAPQKVHITLLHRFLVHRYSVLQQHAEANGVDGVDTLDTASHANKRGYHDDSDEVSLSLLAGG